MRPDDPLGLFIRKLMFRGALPPEDAEAIRALPFTLREIEAVTYIVREGDRPDQCCLLVSGFAYRQKLSGNGDRQILAVHVPGDPLDFHNLFLDVADHSVQMLTRGTVAFVARTRVQELIRQRPAVARAIMVDILADASILREWVLNVGRRNARTRLAHLLCEVFVRLQAYGLAEGAGYELPMTQEQLADALGLTPVHVNRTLKSLADEGLITRSKRQVSCPDWERLRDVGDFNQRYLHLARQETGDLPG